MVSQHECPRRRLALVPDAADIYVARVDLRALEGG